MKILVINPGSTSTKMAVYEEEKPILLRNITHTAEELAPFDAITEQQDFRRQLVLDELRRSDIPLEFDAVIGRGGLVKPIAGGVYEINGQMIEDTLHGCVMHNHACNLGCLIDSGRNQQTRVKCPWQTAKMPCIHCRPWRCRRAVTISPHQWQPPYAAYLHLACFEPTCHSPPLCPRHWSRIRGPQSHHLPSGRRHQCGSSRTRSCH